MKTGLLSTSFGMVSANAFGFHVGRIGLGFAGYIYIYMIFERRTLTHGTLKAGS